MKRTTFDSSRDQRVADEHTVSSKLLCRADGCPNRWSIAEGQFGDGIQGLCSAHAHADHHDWPAVTQAEQDAAFERSNAAPIPCGDSSRHPLGCMHCGTPTDKATLSMLGGRCNRCFDAYVTQGRKPGPMPSREKRIEALQRMRICASPLKQGGKVWASLLREREDAGEPLSPAQKDAWRRALGVRADGLSGADLPAEVAP